MDRPDSELGTDSVAVINFLPGEGKIPPEITVGLKRVKAQNY